MNDTKNAGSILIADDEETFCLAAADILRREGYEVETANSATAAARLFQNRSFDVLILDVNMPGNANLELVTGLANLGVNVPVILVSGYPTIRTTTEAIGLAVLAFLIKPFENEDLLKAVKSGVHRSSFLKAIDGAKSRLESWDTNLSLIRESIAASATGQLKSAVETFVLISLQSIMSSLSDLKQLIDSQAMSGSESKAYQLLGCPPPLQMLAIMRRTVETLERTKGAFKSKELGDLRAYLEGILRLAGPETEVNV